LIASNTDATKSHDSGTDGSALPDQPYPPGPAGNQRQAMAAGSIIDGGVIGESGNDQSEAANNLTVSSQFQSAEYQNSVGRKSSKLRRKDWKGSDIAKEDKNKKKKRGGCQIL
jgi:hypothetical protein